MANTDFEKAMPFSFNELIDYSSGSIISKIIIRKATGNVTFFSFDIGQELSDHTAPFDALVQVTEGIGDVIIDGKSNVLKAGESIIIPEGIIHNVKAVEKFKMLLTMIKSQ